MTEEIAQFGLDEFLGVTEQNPRAKLHKRLMVGGTVVATLLLLWMLFGHSRTANSYAAEAVTHGNLQVHINATGNLAPTNEVSVGSELSGVVDHVFVDVNDHVTKGQVLAQINTLTLRDAITRSRAALAQAQASVGQAQATAQQSQSTLNRLQTVYKLSGGKVPSATELDTAQGDYARGVANLRAAEAQVASARAQLSSDETNFAKATIRSPVTGVVLSRVIEQGQTVAASFSTPTLFTIAEDLSSMKLEVKVDEADVGQVHAGQPASFNVDSFPGRSFPATITRVNLGANATSSTSTTSTSTVVSYDAVLAVQNPEMILRPGMTATADIITNEERNVLLVPNAALRYKPVATSSGSAFTFGPPAQTKAAVINRGSAQTVYVLGADGKPRPVSVVTGASNGSVTVVAGNLSAADKVITGELAVSK